MQALVDTFTKYIAMYLKEEQKEGSRLGGQGEEKNAKALKR